MSDEYTTPPGWRYLYAEGECETCGKIRRMYTPVEINRPVICLTCAWAAACGKPP